MYNHPERLAYSATPPDFGSLVIQRARWANGGLIIFPKLLSLLFQAPKQPQTIVQALLQTHYLTSLALTPLCVLLLLSVPFASDLMTIWMPLAALPYFVLYARDLRLMGYRPVRDLLRVYALNMLLIPVHLTGAVTSVRQALAGTQDPVPEDPKSVRSNENIGNGFGFAACHGGHKCRAGRLLRLADALDFWSLCSGQRCAAPYGIKQIFG